MGYSIGHDDRYDRDVGYGVPAICDHPDCNKEIDRGLSYICGGDLYGGDTGCGLFFCENHLYIPVGDGSNICSRCTENKDPFPLKPDTPEWINWKLTHDSWALWRKNHPEWVKLHSEAR